eukprot:TRINITY_DN70681_c0_g1_i1.p1 TRINITY_DN70681_c0_g1~~TRINITY_DN70681_c0_g1_i1.p1  ORF type:complete len:289 (-),score=66.80 TRINITY_DN70681_c0_g1_i1:29-895(-)
MASSSSTAAPRDGRGVEASTSAAEVDAPAGPATAAGDAQVLEVDRRRRVAGAEASDDEEDCLPDDQVPLDSDTAELALRARLKAEAIARGDREMEFGFEEARDLMMWALDVSRSGAAGLDEPPTYKRRAMLQSLGVFAATSLIFLFLFLFVRANTTEVATRDGFLLATGVPAYRGEEPIASVAALREFRSLESVVSLPAAALGGLRDVTLVHQGIWRCLHVSSVTKFSDSHIWLEAADGTGVRIRGGKAFLREDHLSDEEAIELDGEIFPTNGSTVEAVAHFDVILTR